MYPKYSLRPTFSLPLLLVLTLLPGCLIVEGGLEGELYLTPGSSQQLHIGVGGCCYFILPVPNAAVWTITPPIPGITIHPTTGQLTVDAEVPHGTIVTVHGGTHRATLYIYDPNVAPLVNIWREISQFDCDTEIESSPEEGINEIIFTPAGKFSVTWHPFEVYRDYWGTYTYDHDTGRLEMTIDGGNYIPSDFDGDGTITVEADGTVLLEAIWLGTPNARDENPTPAPSGCGHRLTPNVY